MPTINDGEGMGEEGESLQNVLSKYGAAIESDYVSPSPVLTLDYAKKKLPTLERDVASRPSWLRGSSSGKV